MWGLGKGRACLATALVTFFAVPATARGAEAREFRRAEAGYRYSFPRDHFEHPEFRTEWWYYTGNVRDVTGKRFGFELVFFRQGQARGAAERSAWQVEDLYLAHAALTDIDGKRFYHQQRLNRAGPGIAGASYAEQRVWNGNWSAMWKGERQVLESTADEFHFRLELAPQKPPVVHGIKGISQKGPEAGEASYYVSYTRLQVDGELSAGGRQHQVKGTAWMDHEWFTDQIDKQEVGWDWFSVQLNNQSELMLFQLRRKDGSIDPHSSGTYVDREGRPRHLTEKDFSLKPSSYWRSKESNTSYPVTWQIFIPPLSVRLDVHAALDEQELKSRDESMPTYWEGAVTYSGTESGVGYLEMTGYDRPVRME